MIPDEIKLNWIVVETEQMVKSAISRGLAKGELRFASRIEDVTDAVDFVHSSSTLQYVPAPIDFLNRLIACNASAMLFNRMLFNKHDADIITVQRSLLSANGPGSLPPGYADREIRYPHTAIAIGKVMAAMQAGGYDCFSEFEETSGKISLGKEDVLAKGLLFLQHS